MKNYAIVISTCDNFSDLWEEHIKLFKEHWNGKLPKIYLVTDKNTSRQFDNIEIVSFDGDMPVRLKQALSMIEEEYVLITLDDYFVIQEIDISRIDYLVNYSQTNNISYMSLYNRFLARGYGYKKKKEISSINLAESYAVTLYPAIWNRTFMIDCIQEDITPWKFEPQLTNKAKEFEVKCEFDHSGAFVILDVVRKGKVLHRANRYFKKHNINIGGRPLAKRSQEFKLYLMDFINRKTPKWFSKFLKRIAIKIGMEFYSEG